MNKVLLIIQREYITRVRKKSFIIMIFVVPLLIFCMGFVIALVGKNSTELTSAQVVKVVDHSGQFAGKFKNQNNLVFETSNRSIDDLKKIDLKNDENLSALEIPNDYDKKNLVNIYSKKKPGITLTEKIAGEVNQIALNNGLAKNHIDPAILKSIKSKHLVEYGGNNRNRR